MSIHETTLKHFTRSVRRSGEGMTHTLEPEIFWRLRAHCSETQRLIALSQQVREALVVAQKKQADLVLQIALQFGFDPKTPVFSLDDEQLTLTIPENQEHSSMP